MNGKQLQQILLTIVSAVVKILVALWVVNFVYTKAIEAYDFGYRVFTEEAISPAPGRDVTIAYTDGKKDKDLAEMLEEKGLSRDANLAYLQILASEYRETMEPGMYTVNTSMTVDEILRAMSPNLEAEEEE